MQIVWDRGRMSNEQRKQHWENIYSTRASDEVSWFQSKPTLSLRLIRDSRISPEQPVIDVGGGASVLVDELLKMGFTAVTVLDIATAALEVSRKRLGAQSEQVNWLEADVTDFTLPRPVSLWHDRAVFHFLTNPADRQAYIKSLKKHLAEDGTAIIATFSPEGPKQCSNLDIVQYDAPKICEQLGSDFQLQQAIEEVHVTPSGARQCFNYFVFGYRNSDR